MGGALFVLFFKPKKNVILPLTLSAAKSQGKNP